MYRRGRRILRQISESFLYLALNKIGKLDH